MDVPAINTNSKNSTLSLQSDNLIDQLEKIGGWFAARQGKKLPENLSPALVLFAADHGISYSPYTNERRLTTAQRVINSSSKNSAIRKLAKEASASFHIVDLGVRDDISDAKGVESRVICESGTADIRVSSAMSHDEYRKAIATGKELAERMIRNGSNLLMATSLAARDHVSTSAVVCELTGTPPEEAAASKSHSTHSDELLALDTVLTRRHTANSHDVLRELGGIELVAMASFFHTAAKRGIPVLLDGTAAAVAALAASIWDVRIAGWLLAGFTTDDIAGQVAFEELGLEAIMPMEQGMSDGVGAALLIPLLQSAVTLKRGLVAIETQA